MVSLMWRCREQEEGASMPFERLCKFIVLRLMDFVTASVSGEMMGLVKDNNIPHGRFKQSTHARPTLERVDARNEAIMLGKGIRFPISDIALAAEDFEVKVEVLVQFVVPVVYESGRDNHER